MFRLLSIFFLMISTTLAGIGVFISLVSGFDDLNQIIVFAMAGVVVALPTTLFVTHAALKNHNSTV